MPLVFCFLFDNQVISLFVYPFVHTCMKYICKLYNIICILFTIYQWKNVCIYKYVYVCIYYYVQRLLFKKSNKIIPSIIYYHACLVKLI